MTHVTHRDAFSYELRGRCGQYQDGMNTVHGAHRENASRASRASLRHGPAAELDALACAVGRLSPSHRDPEAFHVSKSEIVAELRRLARKQW